MPDPGLILPPQIAQTGLESCPALRAALSRWLMPVNRG
jgi:hypothetical protein